MIIFNKEVQRFSPSNDVSSVEEMLVNADISDMRDIVADILKGAAEKAAESADK